MNINHVFQGVLFGTITVLVFASFPFSVDAQSRNRYTREQLERWQEEWQDTDEGESNTNSEDNIESYSTRRGVSSSLRKKINALDEDKVENVPIPVLFGISVTSLFPNFGDPRDGGARSHEGLDIIALEDTPIVSPTDAVVLRTGSGSSSGKYVYTANPGGETFVYMHLTEIADIDSGDVIEAGDVIGYVGNTGNASGGPAHLHFEIRDGKDATDPFPRLTLSFNIEEKMEFLEGIFDDVSDEEDFAEFLVKNFRSDFLSARAQDIDLPKDIVDALQDSAAVVIASTAGVDLTIGSTGTDVVVLQNFLITTDTGISARALSAVGATGYFGTLTRQALAEYQLSKGIVPAVGYYGPITRAYIATAVQGGN